MNSAKHSFFCGIEASHEGDSAQAEVVAYFERVSVDRNNYYNCNNFAWLAIIAMINLILTSVALHRRKLSIQEYIKPSLR